MLPYDPKPESETMNTELIRIEPSLIRDVVKATGITIKARAIRKAIEEYLGSQKRKGLKNLAGKLRFYSQEDLEKSRRDV
jgi:Arc/MetJ family transcription regulator